MCGIVGLYLKNPAFEPELGRLFTPMLIKVSDRGPDSAGIVIYQDPLEDEDAIKLTLFYPDDDVDWKGLVELLGEELQLSATIDDIASHAVLISDGDPELLTQAIESYDPDIPITIAGMSSGSLSAQAKEALGRGATALGTTAGAYDDWHEGRNPAGITTQDPELATRLDPVKAGRRLANYLGVLILELQTLARANGKSYVHNLEPEDLAALTVEAAAMAGVPLAGTSWIPGT